MQTKTQSVLQTIVIVVDNIKLSCLYHHLKRLSNKYYHLFYIVRNRHLTKVEDYIDDHRNAILLLYGLAMGSSVIDTNFAGGMCEDIEEENNELFRKSKKS